MAIHETAVVHPEATLGEGVVIGPFAVVGPRVTLADGVQVGSHAVLEGELEVGEGCVLHAHVCLGGPPQHPSEDVASGRTVIGAHCVLREFVTVNAGSSEGRGETTVGEGGYFMAHSHIAHDCQIGSGVVFANAASVAAHAEVGAGATLGAHSSVNDRVRIGRMAMVGAGARCAQDVPPFTLAQGDRARLFGLNIVGLRKEGVDGDELRALKNAWRRVFTSGLAMRTGIRQARQSVGDAALAGELLDFLQQAHAGVCRAASVGR